MLRATDAGDVNDWQVSGGICSAPEAPAFWLGWRSGDRSLKIKPTGEGQLTSREARA